MRPHSSSHFYLSSPLFYLSSPHMLSPSTLHAVQAHLDTHVWEELQLVTDKFTRVMEGRLMQAVLRKHAEGLKRVFMFYAGQVERCGEGWAARG
jgi:hypothetical protein